MCDRLIVSAGCRPAAAAAVTRSGRAVIVLIDTFRLWTTVQLRQDGPALWAISWGCWHQGRLTHKLWSSGTLIVLISTDQNRGYIWPVEMFCPACCSGLWTRVIGSCLQDYLWLNHFSLPAGRRNRVGGRMNLRRFVLLAVCLSFSLHLVYLPSTQIVSACASPGSTRSSIISPRWWTSLWSCAVRRGFVHATWKITAAPADTWPSETPWILWTCEYRLSAGSGCWIKNTAWWLNWIRGRFE